MSAVIANNGTSPPDVQTDSSSKMDSDDKGDAHQVHVQSPARSKLTNMATFSGIYAISGLMTSTLSSYVNGQVTTIERHFGFSSEQTGIIMAANDIGFLVIVLFVSHIATRVHIPRFMGFATVLFGISGILCALPQFLFGAPSPSDDIVMGNVSKAASAGASQTFQGQMCDTFNTTKLSACLQPSTSTNTGVDTSSISNRARANAMSALVIIVLGMVLQGVAKAPRHPLITTFVDNNIDKTKTGFYMGIILTFGVMGPAAAFALGGVFTRMYVTLEETNIGPRHPKWIGAWWLGYITFGGAACLFSLPLFCFPRSFKRDNPQEKRKTDTTNHFYEFAVKYMKGFLAAMHRLVKNPVYMTQVISSCFFTFAVAGTQRFAPKYIENQFSYPAWRANMSMAVVMLSSACVGTFIGGFLSRRFKMGPLASLKFASVFQMASCAGTGLQMAFTCQQPSLYNSPGPLATIDESQAGCFDGCTCDDMDYFPVCGADGRTYFSPCHAGCLEHLGGTYQNCTCIGGGTATAGVCDYSCPMFYPFMIGLACQALFGTFAIVPTLIVTIRCVEDKDKGLALGFLSFMTSVTGWMLGPVLYGKVVDDICIQWDNTCEGRGYCRLYDNSVFRWKLIGSQFCFRFIGCIIVFISLAFAVVRKTFEDKPKAGKVEDLELDHAAAQDMPRETNNDVTKKLSWGHV
ncbi:solute carrier organic anion transporter family member 2A1-like isoform X2 [Pomacea canaliculata]|uniref:solute carrier organic anion transporter family member 2A1-like isoform X2 n=1 Tax=Pomacea canaliculata TaxID=400727 RepID=UPI000D7288A4|nr:solute carrier organic anion transporter family member 2A1-like isoform X2 [Pomacea canaliculata]